MTDQRLLKTILKQEPAALLTGIGCIAIIGYLYGAGFLTNQFVRPEFSSTYIFFMFVYTLAAWAWVVVTLNFCFGLEVLKNADKKGRLFYVSMRDNVKIRQKKDSLPCLAENPFFPNTVVCAV
jgi:hypothetical protein